MCRCSCVKAAWAPRAPGRQTGRSGNRKTTNRQMQTLPLEEGTFCKSIYDVTTGYRSKRFLKRTHLGERESRARPTLETVSLSALPRVRAKGECVNGKEKPQGFERLARSSPASVRLLAVLRRRVATRREGAVRNCPWWFRRRDKNGTHDLGAHTWHTARLFSLGTWYRQKF